MDDPRELFLRLNNENKNNLPSVKKIVINLLEAMIYITKDYIESGRKNEMGMSILEFKYGSTDKNDTGLIMYVFDNISKIEINYYYDHLTELYSIVKVYL